MTKRIEFDGQSWPTDELFTRVEEILAKGQIAPADLRPVIALAESNIEPADFRQSELLRRCLKVRGNAFGGAPIRRPEPTYSEGNPHAGRIPAARANTTLTLRQYETAKAEAERAASGLLVVQRDSKIARLFVEAEVAQCALSELERLAQDWEVIERHRRATEKEVAADARRAAREGR